MHKTLGGREHKCTNLHLAMLHGLLRQNPTDKNSFYKKISKGNVRLARSGVDLALAVPYLKIIILRLGNDQWLRDMEVPALQPSVLGSDKGVVRRATNILLA